MKNLARKALTILDVLKPDAPSVAAADLAALLDASEREQGELQARCNVLSERRIAALRTGEDAEVDAIEAELSTVNRALDRLEVRLPDLRRHHAEVEARERSLASAKAYEAAVVARVGAAGEMDDAFAALGRAYQGYELAGRNLAVLQPHHRADRMGEGPIGHGETAGDAVSMVLRRHAPGLADALGLHRLSFTEGTALREREERFWSSVSARIPAAGHVEPQE